MAPWILAVPVLAFVALVARAYAKRGEAPGGPTALPGGPSSTSPASQPSGLAALTPKAGNPARAQRIRNLATLLRQVWPEVSGESGPMPAAALEIALAQSGLETTFGGGWSDKSPGSAWATKHPELPPQGDMRDSNNFGAHHCRPGDKGGANYKCVPYGDTRPASAAEIAAGKPAQIRFDVDFKSFSSPLDGAKDFLASIIKDFPAKAELLAGDVHAYALRQGPKYRKDEPQNQLVLGKPYTGGNYYYGGFGATMEDRVLGYDKAIAGFLPEVAAALGQDKVYATVPAAALAKKGKAHEAVSGVEMVYARPCSVCWGSSWENLPENDNDETEAA